MTGTVVFLISILFVIVTAGRFVYTYFWSVHDDVEPHFQSVNVGRITVRVTTDEEIFDVLIQGRAVYASKELGILVEDAQRMFAKWREDGAKQASYRIERDRWIGIDKVHDILLIEEVEHYEDVRIG